MRKLLPIVVGTFLLATFVSCGNDRETSGAKSTLAGAWKSRIQFQSGSLASVKDLEFMYVFNKGGTMTESSNYDAAPPVPPAYGVWRSVGSNQFEARYEFYMTRKPAPEEAAIPTDGWLPGGHGVLTEKINLSADGNSFSSGIQYEVFDPSGKRSPGGGTGTGNAARLTFK